MVPGAPRSGPLVFPFRGTQAKRVGAMSLTISERARRAAVSPELARPCMAVISPGPPHNEAPRGGRGWAPRARIGKVRGLNDATPASARALEGVHRANKRKGWEQCGTSTPAHGENTGLPSGESAEPGVFLRSVPQDSPLAERGERRGVTAVPKGDPCRTQSAEPCGRIEGTLSP